MTGNSVLKCCMGFFTRTGNALTLRGNGYPQVGFPSRTLSPRPLSDFGDGRMFQMGGKFGAVSFLQIVAPELSDRMLADFMDAENGIIVNLHIQSIDHNEAIKTIKRKITDLDRP